MAAAVEFAQDGFSDQVVARFGDEGADWQSLVGRGLHVAHVADTGDRHVKGARNGRGGQGQHIDGRAKPLHVLFVFDAEFLFLVDDHQAKVVEGDVALNEAVSADDDVDLAFGQSF